MVSQSEQVFKQELLDMVRQAVTASAKGRAVPAATFTHQRFKQQLGVFVTLKKQDQLRGCIGLIQSDQPLLKTVPEMARAAAAEDPRFDPVTSDELDQIKLEVSILTKPKLINNHWQIEPGKHGVIIEYAGRKGVFLPQVATEYDYDRQQLLSALCSHKLGLSEACWQDDKAKIYIFQAEIYQGKLKHDTTQ